MALMRDGVWGIVTKTEESSSADKPDDLAKFVQLIRRYQSVVIVHYRRSTRSFCSVEEIGKLLLLLLLSLYLTRIPTSPQCFSVGSCINKLHHYSYIKHIGIYIHYIYIYIYITYIHITYTHIYTYIHYIYIHYIYTYIHYIHACLF